MARKVYTKRCAKGQFLHGARLSACQHLSRYENHRCSAGAWRIICVYPSFSSFWEISRVEIQPSEMALRVASTESG